MKGLAEKQLKKEQEAHPEIILRDFLAIDRTRLANQRTLLSFLRTGLYLLVTDLAVQKVEMLEGLSYLGGIFVALSAATVVIGVVNYLAMRKKIEAHYRMSPNAKGDMPK